MAGYTIVVNEVTATGQQVRDSVGQGFHDEVVWDDIILNPESLGTGASAPDLTTFVGNTRAYAFNGATTLEQLYGSFEIPHGYKEGTDLRPHIHWSPTTAGTGNVKWQMEYVMAKVDQTFTTSTTTITAIDSTNAISNQHLAVEFGMMSGIDVKIGEVCRFRLFRDPTDVLDTYGADAALMSLGIHYEIDGDGSRTTFVK